MNSFGRLFRISIFGESHGPAIGITIDGCPAGIKLRLDDFNEKIERRKPGKKGTTPRKESDIPHFNSGVYNDLTTGAPINITFENSNTRSDDYTKIARVPRPGHADFTARKKFNGFNDPRGGGHFSGRITLPLLCAGVIADKILNGVDISTKLLSVHGSTDIEKAVEEAISRNDSVGGIIECTVKNIPEGLGNPFFDSLESVISHAIFSIPGIKGIEFGAGFRTPDMFGSEYNDEYEDNSGRTLTNNSGGINGGISNGNDIVFRVAVRPPASIPGKQRSFNFETGESETLEISGRHDACFALRVPVIIEAVTSIVLTDAYLIRKSESLNHV